MTYINRVFNHSCESMAELPDSSVHCVVTSPPYWGLRDYTGAVGMIGKESTLQEHLARLVAVFRQVRRVLRPDGTLWLNYGDAYNAGTSASRKPSLNVEHGYWENGGSMGDRRVNAKGFKAKDLLLMPARLAIALQDDGWWVRSDIIWHKPNPMPSSVTDRPTSSHEYVFLLSKSPRYFYDAEAIREPLKVPDAAGIPFGGVKRAGGDNETYSGREYDAASLTGANKRDVWTIATRAYPGAHFATFPPELVQPCILAGTSQKGVCSACGAPWKRLTSVEYVKSPKHGAGSVVGRHDASGENNFDGAGMPRVNKQVETLGWEASCSCGAEVEPAIVLDPFMGSGTTAQVSTELGRRFVGYEISPEYCALIRDRLGLFGEGVA